jgi:TRAP-type C4-dicarboxylate transport system permease small subunit
MTIALSGGGGDTMKKQKVLNILKLLDDHFEEFICVILFVWVIGLIFFQVVDRYALTFVSVPWTEEIGRYSYIWMVFLGAGACTRYSAHLQVDILKGYLPEKGKRIQAIAINLACIALFIILFPSCRAIFDQVFNLARPLPTSRAPEWIFTLVLPVMCIVMIARSAEIVIKEIIAIKRGASGSGDEDTEVSAS